MPAVIEAFGMVVRLNVRDEHPPPYVHSSG